MFKHVLRASLSVLLLWILPPAWAGDAIRVGVYGFPVGAGNPFQSTSISETFVYSAVYDSLTQIDEDGSVLPMLALSWQAVDPVTWLFDLRPNVTFSNGEPFTADAVVKVVEYLTSPAARGDTMARELSTLASARTISTLIVEIKTKAPSLILPTLMAAVRVPAPTFTDQLIAGMPTEAPVGTGPFAVTEWNNNRLYLIAHKASWRPPKVSRLEFWLVPERTARLQAVISGDLHIAYGLGTEDIPNLERSGHDYFSDHAGGVFGLSFINVKEGPIQSQKVRQALNYAVNKQAYIDVLLQGRTLPASQATPSVAYGFDPELKPYPYNPDRARELLAEAGYQQGFELVVEAVIGGTTSGSEIMQFVAAQLADVGVRMEIRAIPISELIRKLVNGGFAGAAFAMDFGTIPTLDALRPLPMHSCLRTVPWYCDPVVVPWIEEAQTTFDPERRLELLRMILRRYHENPPMLFLHEAVAVDGLNKSLKGFAPRARLPNYHDLEFMD